MNRDSPASIRTSSQPECYFCRTPGEILYEGLTDRLFGAPGKWGFRQCPNAECGLVWLDPTPSASDLGKCYECYYTHRTQHVRTGGTAFRTALRGAYRTFMNVTGIRKQRQRLADMYLDTRASGKLLDVGCGDGSRLARMRELGWQVEGQELDAQAAATAHQFYKLQVRVGPLEEIGYPSESFDAVTMNHVIEHVYEPIELLSECRRILKPSGRLVVVTPNTESLGHRLFKANWRGLEPPRHLLTFCPRTLRILVQRAGFTTFRTWTTAAHAELIAEGSLQVAAAASGAKPPQTSVRRRLASVCYQVCAQLFSITYPGTGEECVMEATK
jgi:2-polyprenyl-3-methyl-5-hydroxy-6-metoxy-1,4-benzoquinol methylase